jgi:hypothetical protein
MCYIYNEEVPPGTCQRNPDVLLPREFSGDNDYDSQRPDIVPSARVDDLSESIAIELQGWSASFTKTICELGAKPHSGNDDEYPGHRSFAQKPARNGEQRCTPSEPNISSQDDHSPGLWVKVLVDERDLMGK